MLWWGYLHVNGNIQVKRFFHINDLKDAKESPFVHTVIGPFTAADKNTAALRIKEKILARKD